MRTYAERRLGECFKNGGESEKNKRIVFHNFETHFWRRKCMGEGEYGLCLLLSSTKRGRHPSLCSPTDPVSGCQTDHYHSLPISLSLLLPSTLTLPLNVCVCMCICFTIAVCTSVLHVPPYVANILQEEKKNVVHRHKKARCSPPSFFLSL